VPGPFWVGGAAIAAAAVAAATAAACRRAGSGGPRLAAAAGVLAGALAGAWLLDALPRLPPATALGRLLVVGLPLAAVVEGALAIGRPARGVAAIVRGAAALLLARVLLHGSVHLLAGPAAGAGSVMNSAATGSANEAALFAAVLAALAWPFVAADEHRADGGAVAALAAGLALLAAGAAIPLAGYVKGGLVAVVLAAAVVGCLGGGGRVGIAGVAFAAVVGIAGVGRFFGGLSSPAAVLLLSAPVLAVAAGRIGDRLGDAPAGRVMRSPAYRLALAIVPLAIVVVHEWREFDRSFRPLLGPPGVSVAPSPAGRGLAPLANAADSPRSGGGTRAASR
jgi:hypothetical protein